MKYLLFFLTILFILPLVSSAEFEIPPVITGDCTQLITTCANCTFVNLSSVRYPDGSMELFNTVMQKKGINYNFTFCNTSIAGNYIYTSFGDPNGLPDGADTEFIVNQTGTEQSTSKAILYVLLFFVSFILFGFCVYGGLVLPYANNTDKMTGYILSMNNLKYLKILCWAVGYLMVILMSYFSWNISLSYLDLPFVTELFKFLFYSLVVLLLPLFIVGFYITIANAIQDHKVGEALQRGFRVRE